MRPIAKLILVLAFIALLAGLAVALGFIDSPSARADYWSSDGVLRLLGGSSGHVVDAGASGAGAAPYLCERADGTGDLEPCEWQAETREAARKQAEKQRAFDKCRTKDGCRVEHYRWNDCTPFGTSGIVSCLAIYRNPNDPMWRCNCDWRIPPAARTSVRATKATDVKLSPPLTKGAAK